MSEETKGTTATEPEAAESERTNTTGGSPDRRSRFADDCGSIPRL